MQNIQNTKQHGYVSGREFSAIAKKLNDVFSTDAGVASYKELEKIGVHLDQGAQSSVRFLNSVMDQYPINPMQPNLTTPNIITPVQFLQNWLPGFVNYLTWARRIDEFIGMKVVGSFEDAQIVQGFNELTGEAVPYGDTSNTTFSSFNTTWDYRSVQQFKMGLQIPMLQEMRASRARIDYASNVRESALLALEILRNAIGFYGWNDGLSLTYGFLNDPGETAYQVVATGLSGSTTWASKTYLEIWADIRTAAAYIRTLSGDNIDAHRTPMTLAVATSVVDQLDNINNLGNQSVMQLIKQTYPNMRVLSAPELDDAHLGDNVFYMYADSVREDNGSTDDGAVFAQYVPSKFYTLGVERKVTGVIEGYANATAGAYCKRPYGVVRYYGI